MADIRDIEIEIYGELTSLEAIKELASEMDGFVAPDYGEGYLDYTDAFSHILKSLESGSPIKVVRDDTSDDLDGIAMVCREHGLAYSITGHKTQWLDAHLENWAPGFKAPMTPSINEEHDIVIPLDELKKLAKKGLEAVAARIAELDRLALNDIDRKVTSSQEVLEAARNYDPDEEEAPSP